MTLQVIAWTVVGFVVVLVWDCVRKNRRDRE